MRRLGVHHDKDTNTVAVSFDLPGLQKEGVKIDVHNDVLTVPERPGRPRSSLKKDMRSASGDTASLGGQSRSRKGSR